MAAILFRIGGLLIVVGIVQMAAWEAFLHRENGELTRTLLEAGAVCLAGGTAAWMAGRAGARLLSAGCPRCGRRVARSRVFCEDHLQESINSYRDQLHKRRG